MVSYPDIGNLSSDSTIGEFLSLPNASYPYFWAWIMGGIFLIITFTLYFSEKERIGKGKMLASMAVSSLAIILLSVIGTLVGIISLEIMIFILVLSVLIIVIWFFSTG